jgi:anthranilate 1,2-dioxygenase large subunit
MISERSSVHQAFPRWEHADHSRVPYWLFQRPDVFLSEQVRLFRGPTWHYLGLEVEVANPGD